MGEARDRESEGGSQATEARSGEGCAPGETHSFIIKIWLEERAEDLGRALWRGHITHVPSRARAYLRTLDDVTGFIRPYVQKMEVPTGAAPRRRNLQRLFSSIRRAIRG